MGKVCAGDIRRHVNVIITRSARVFQVRERVALERDGRIGVSAVSAGSEESEEERRRRPGRGLGRIGTAVSGVRRSCRRKAYESE